MNHLLNEANTGDSKAVRQTNWQRVDESLAFALNPTKVAGVATVIVGPPTTGERYVGELWKDALCAVWRCTVAGTPGTWRQQEPAIVTTAARPVAPPDGYWILDTDEHFKAYYWNDGGAAWTAV